MMKFFLHFIFITNLLILTVGKSYGINLLEVYNIAIKNDPELLAAELKHKAIAQEYPIARSYLLPNLNFSASSQRTRESIEESLKTMSVDKVDLLFLHDPEYVKDINDIKKKDGAFDELFKLKEEGMTKAVGLAMGKIDIMFPMIKNWDFDVLINHNRYTLLNREANDMYDYAYSKNIAIINAAPYAGGVLAKGPSNFKKITYQDVSEEKLAPAREIEKICKNYNIEIGAAALQFSMRDKRITSTLCGVTSVQSIEKNLEWANLNIPNQFWDEILKLPYSSRDPEAERIYTPG